MNLGAVERLHNDGVDAVVGSLAEGLSGGGCDLLGKSNFVADEIDGRRQQRSDKSSTGVFQRGDCDVGILVFLFFVQGRLRESFHHQLRNALSVRAEKDAKVS